MGGADILNGVAEVAEVRFVTNDDNSAGAFVEGLPQGGKRLGILRLSRVPDEGE